MTKFKFISAIALIISLSSFTISNSISWNISDDFSIKFSSKNPSGVFTKLTGNIEFDEANLAASKLDLSVDVASINTGNGMKNRHAKGKKWFNAEEFPTINFTAQDFKKTATGYEATGILKMHGIEKEYTIPFTFNNNTFESSFTVNRTDFNVGAVTGMAKKVPHEMNLEVSIPVTK
ncbi:YceI family protein [Thalassobellus citreus]|uniref:YceI family protein n=1 Tax=Thalassobellus citreus TaxID=3367752 RepID=UPI00379BC36C